ncbi:hypothetical protein [Rhodohalobacter sp. 8-1]|uniref:hypothetical protein n=1 Tax=Rhodohalobacter sp. 8-1 TaxID=3131972 RepID=UPI0030EBD874
MNKYYFIFLIWLLPAYFLFQGSYQVLIYYGIEKTYTEGESYVADVLEFDVKQIAAQTNGYVILRFTTRDGNTVTEQLALPVQMAQVIMESEQIPIRYLAESFKPIVMLTVYELQKSVVLVNMAVSSLGLIFTLIVSGFASRFAIRRLRHGEDTLEIERLDTVNA